MTNALNAQLGRAKHWKLYPIDLTYQMYRCVSLSSETRLLISPKQLHANQTESVSDGAINQSAVFLYFMFSLFLKDPFFSRSFIGYLEKLFSDIGKKCKTRSDDAE